MVVSVIFIASAASNGACAKGPILKLLLPLCCFDIIRDVLTSVTF